MGTQMPSPSASAKRVGGSPFQAESGSAEGEPCAIIRPGGAGIVAMVCILWRQQLLFPRAGTTVEAVVSSDAQLRSAVPPISACRCT